VVKVTQLTYLRRRGCDLPPCSEEGLPGDMVVEGQSVSQSVSCQSNGLHSKNRLGETISLGILLLDSDVRMAMCCLCLVLLGIVYHRRGRTTSKPVVGVLKPLS